MKHDKINHVLLFDEDEQDLLGCGSPVAEIRADELLHAATNAGAVYVEEMMNINSGQQEGSPTDIDWLRAQSARAENLKRLLGAATDRVRGFA